MAAAAALALAGWSGVAHAQSAAPAGAAQVAPASRGVAQHRTAQHRPPLSRLAEPPPRSPLSGLDAAGRPVCGDGEAAGPAALTALAAGDEGFVQLLRERPEEGFRCAALFPGPAATAALREAAPQSPYDAVGAADQLFRRPGGGAVVAAALRPELLARALDSGLPFFETRHELRRLLPPQAFRLLEIRAGDALTAAFARDPVTFAARIGALVDGMDEDPSTDRFRIVAALPAEHLYQIVARIGPQLYTSSFDGILDVLEAKLKRQRRSFLALAGEPETAPLWADFFVAAVAGGRADTLFGPAAGDPRRLAAESVRALLAAERAPDPPIIAAALADAMEARSEDARAALAAAMAEQSAAPRSPSVTATVALAAGLHAQRHAQQHAGRPAPSPAAVLLASPLTGDPLPIPAVPTLAEERLFSGGVNLQRMTFYDDPDGRATFRRFLSLHRGAGWTVEERPGFVLVSSPERRGRRIVIAADIPWAGEEGRKAVRAWLAEQGRAPSIVIHRGHSYHEDETMPEIGPGTALVFWGSCGGHQRLRATLDQAPDALVLATSNIGTSQINQALLHTIEERLLTHGTIDWEAAWTTVRAQVRDRRFSAYQRPDRNSTLLALRAWRTLLQSAATPARAQTG
ncbi:hypothetical protein [Azospirillum thermophilum]|uniref:Uncharacterized protein n=1 Tax=Azospirillum thermophilum TaxID=2202148 RepID=A0A2S2CZA2_9PROT|nr:hypothetical protein [Azospirillum thermophilum]AWK89853.1 hypothetical protein DEW08_27885 [Azospirillum thermophilum]